MVPLALTGLLLAGCLQSAAPASNVEGTVQARVSATVGAQARPQLSPARSSQATVIPIATAAATDAAPAATAATAAAAGREVPSPSPVGASAATTAVPGASAAPSGSPARQASAPAASGTLAVPTAFPTSPASSASTLSFGTLARMSGVAVTVNRYEWGYTCPGNGDAGIPTKGAKFVTVYASGRNDGADAVNVPSLQWTLEGYPAENGTQSSCRQDNQAFASACRPGGRLAPDARCQGWLLFMVPETMPVSGAVVQAQAAGTAQWRLPG